MATGPSIFLNERFEKIKQQFLPNDITLLDNALCYDKIMYYNIMYKIDHVLITLVEGSLLAYKLKKI